MNYYGYNPEEREFIRAVKSQNLFNATLEEVQAKMSTAMQGYINRPNSPALMLAMKHEVLGILKNYNMNYPRELGGKIEAQFEETNDGQILNVNLTIKKPWE